MDCEFEGERRLRKQKRRNYNYDVDDVIEGKRTFSVEEKLNSPKFAEGNFVKTLKGDEFTLKYIQETGFTSPVIIKSQDGLGMRVPHEDFSVEDVKNYVGARRMVDVIDVNTQQALEMTLQQWVKYFTSPEREDIYNVISLEFSHTKLEDLVEPPEAVRAVDWVNVVWPQHLIDQQRDATNSLADMKYPKVRKYVLMSVGGCYTDFHIDFGGTSVWYHIMKGNKVFWLIPPTKKNLDLYEQWVLSGKQQNVFFGDQVEKCSRAYLEKGDTFLIPTGWIHAVFTPTDALVFGGNFLQSFNIAGQIKISEIEDNTKVPLKFRYPFNAEILWYAADKYTRLLEKDQQERQALESSADHTDITSVKSDASKSKGKSPSKRTTRGEEKEDVEKSTTSSKGQDSGGEAAEVANRRRSSRVAKNEALPRQENSGKRKTRTNGVLAADDEGEESKGKRATPKKSSSEIKLKEEANGETCVEGGEPDADKDEAGNSVTESEPWRSVYLTRFEIEGLGRLIEKLCTCRQNKKNIPPTVEDPEGLLTRLQELLELHRKDDPILAASGMQHLLQIDKPAVKKMATKKQGSRGPMIGTKVGPGIRRRRTRCGQCDNCQREDCGECRTCKDMKKFGGPGRMKQSCLSRVCTDPNLPTCVHCLICNQVNSEDNPLMECRFCGDIVHPPCLDTQLPSRIVTDINNCWECPKCYQNTLASPSSAEQYTAGKKRKASPLKDPSKKMKNIHVPESGKRSKSKMDNESSDEESDSSTSAANDEEVAQSRPRRAVVVQKAPLCPPPEVLAKRVVRPCPAIPPLQSFPLVNGQSHVMDRQLWLVVFSYLSPPELCLCMRVCRTWNRWCLDRRLWSVIDLSEKRVVGPSALQGIVRRQPTTLNLSWTNVSFKQLQWLLNRLPRIRELYLSGTTDATVFALSTVMCPRLKVLGLSWSVGITDSLLKELLISSSDPHGGTGESKGPFHGLCTLFLSGCDVTGSTLRLLVQYCPELRKLDLSLCPGITDQDIESVCGQAAIKDFLLSGCPNLSDKCLTFLKLFPLLIRLDLRSCPRVTPFAVQEFAKSRKEFWRIMEEKLLVVVEA